MFPPHFTRKTISPLYTADGAAVDGNRPLAGCKPCSSRNQTETAYRIGIRSSIWKWELQGVGGDLQEDLVAHETREGPPCGVQLPQDDAKAVDVGCAGQAAVHEQLGGHVGHSAVRGCLYTLRPLLHQAAHAKITHLLCKETPVRQVV